jgi:hypothetical protein
MKRFLDVLIDPVYKLIEVYEFDLDLDNDRPSFRLELFQALDNDNRFRCRVREHEIYRMNPTFPQDQSDDTPAKSAELLIEGSLICLPDLLDFEAADAKEALDQAVKAIRADFNERMDSKES